MSSYLFSTPVLREIINEVRHMKNERLLHFSHKDWPENMAAKYQRQLDDLPLVKITETENAIAKAYLKASKKYGVNIAERATRFTRVSHAADIRKFLKGKQDGRLETTDQQRSEHLDDRRPSLLRNDGPPTCFEEWAALANVWRVTLAMTVVSWPEAAYGTSTCRVEELPKPWEDALDECMQVTEASAVIPVPKGQGFPLRRRDIDSILPCFNPDDKGLLSGGIINAWFQILVSDLNEHKRDSAMYIPPDSVQMIANTPQEITENAKSVNCDLDVVMFPIVLKELDHCILVVAHPNTKEIFVYDPRGTKSTAALQKPRPWIKQGYQKTGQNPRWDMSWSPCPGQGAENASGVFMLINSLCLCRGEKPADKYSREDVTFLRRYIAAVICRGKLPERE